MVTHITPMTEDEYIAHFSESIKAYAKDKIASGQWAAADALNLAQKEIDNLLPQGFATPEHWFFTVRDESAQKVGAIWISLREQGGRKIAWLTDIVVLPQFQRQGHAKRALLAAEQVIAAEGLPGMGLHVFGHNTGAQALYASMGYAVTNVNMFKPLG